MFKKHVCLSMGKSWKVIEQDTVILSLQCNNSEDEIDYFNRRKKKYKGINLFDKDKN